MSEHQKAANTGFEVVYDIGPPVPIEPNPLDDIHGPAAIAAHIGLSEERTRDLLERGLLPARKINGEFVCRRSRLVEIFGGRDA